MIKVIRLNSDNFQDELVTIEAYEEIRLQMSSGDFGAHTIKYEYVSSFENVITLMDL